VLRLFIIYNEKGDDYMTDKLSRGLSAMQLKVDVDVSEALTGLKALQREAKKATQDLRELETAFTDMADNKRYFVRWKQSEDDECTDICEVCLSDIPTKYLQRELAKREGVTTYEIAPHGANAKLTIDNVNTGQTVTIEGPAIVTVNKD